MSKELRLTEKWKVAIALIEGQEHLAICAESTPFMEEDHIELSETYPAVCLISPMDSLDDLDREVAHHIVTLHNNPVTLHNNSLAKTVQIVMENNGKLNTENVLLRSILRESITASINILDELNQEGRLDDNFKLKLEFTKKIMADINEAYPDSKG